MISSQQAETEFVTLTISDEGSGISPEIATRIFEPFFTTKKDYGTGLGLWVSKKLIEDLGGSIAFESRTTGNQRGTTFSVRIPAAKREAAAAI